MKAIIMMWLPWSGKSTWAERQKWYIIISKDIIRETISDERAVSLSQWNMIWECALKNLNIIIDNTNISNKTFTLDGDLKEYWYDVTIKNMDEWYKSIYKYRRNAHLQNRMRDWHKRVPDYVIDWMFLNKYLSKEKFTKIVWWFMVWLHKVIIWNWESTEKVLYVYPNSRENEFQRLKNLERITNLNMLNISL